MQKQKLEKRKGNQKMAPKRKQTTANNSAAVTAGCRVTRSSTRFANATVNSRAADPELPKKKKAKTTTKQKGDAHSPRSQTGKEQVSELAVVNCSRTILIEHCKQCNSFKTRAFQVKSELEKSIAGVNVVVNPEKPRRGCFEIREEGGEVFVSLLDMKRPFPPLKALDMEKVISDIVEKIR